MLSNVPCPDNLAWQLVFSKASAHACAVAVHMGTTSLTYSDLQSLVHATAQALARAGGAQGDRIVLVLPNSPEYIVAFIAVVALGAIAVPLPASITAERLRAVIDDTAAKLCGAESVHSTGPHAGPGDTPQHRPG